MSETILPETQPPTPEKKLGFGKWRPAMAFVLFLAVSSVLYRALVMSAKEQTALMFIGLPTILALLLCAAPPTKTITGSIMKGITLFLLMLAILLIEGFICILMAAPFFYSIGFIIGIFADKARAQHHISRMHCAVVAVILLCSLEGINDSLSFSRTERIEVCCDYPGTVAEAEAALARGPSFDWWELPTYLKMGFPYPQRIQGDGLKTGDRWQIDFAGGEGKPGSLVAQVMVSEPGHFVVQKITDGSHISHWMEWQQAEWFLEAQDQGTTKVRLQMSYRRLLDPAWYFAPVQRYGVRIAGEYFLDQTFGKD
ncbi:MAG: hypothetical protein RI957_1828 [Verrucomicrobiota bacterium]